MFTNLTLTFQGKKLWRCCFVAMEKQILINLELEWLTEFKAVFEMALGYQSQVLGS
jgi:hypothetical protein